MKVLPISIMLICFFGVTGNAYAAPTNKVDICHNGHTINISGNAVKAHLAHGDYEYACNKVYRAVALFRCGGPELSILAVSLSRRTPEKEGLLAVGSSCSDSIDLLINNGFTSTHINTVYDAALSGLVTDYGYTGPRVK